MPLIVRQGVESGMEKASFDAKHRQCKQCKVEIQARDVNDITLCPSPMYHILKRLQI